MVKVVDGRAIKREILDGIRKEIRDMVSKGYRKPRVATILVGENKESEIFLRLKDKACDYAGIDHIHLRYPESVSEEKILKDIERLNNDEGIDGISVQFPLPNHISSNLILSSIPPDKDVESLNPSNLGRTILGNADLVPCTPGAVMEILEREGVNLKGKDVVVINHSPIIGRPLSQLLLSKDATVTICHVHTKGLEDHTRKADVLITATGVPRLIKRDHVKEGSVVIDVGIRKTEEGIIGDVDFEEVKGRASLITPVPGGVGPVTIAMFIRNLFRIYRRRMG